VRILLVSALLVATASCAWPPPQQAEAPLASQPPPAAPVVYLPNPLAFLFAPILPAAPPPPGRLTLSNFSFDHAHVQALITPYPDCAAHEGTLTSDFVMPLNGTRVIEAAPGTDVCWRREIAPGTEPGAAPSTAGWTEWNREFVAVAGSVDSRL
jgi:hypothetical protein